MPVPKSNAGGVSAPGLVEAPGFSSKRMRSHAPGSVSRRTAETDVAVSVALDGTGKAEISTGIGFLDHMLELSPAMPCSIWR